MSDSSLKVREHYNAAAVTDRIKEPYRKPI
jgi:hypothetical protein